MTTVPTVKTMQQVMESWSLESVREESRTRTSGHNGCGKSPDKCSKVDLDAPIDFDGENVTMDFTAVEGT